jgi:hypothetical protein
MNTTRRTHLLIAAATTFATLLGACGPLPEDDAGLEGEGEAGLEQPLSTSCVPGPTQVALFTDSNQRGACTIFTAPAGEKLGLVHFVGFEGFPNDAASSIAVGSQVSATLFDHGNFGGAALHAPASGNLAMNDKTSSLIILPKSRDCWFNAGFQPRQGEVVVWDEADFGGRCHVYRIDERFALSWDDIEVTQNGHGDDMGSPGQVFMLEFTVKSDTISSVKVGPGTKVTLYKDSGLMGTSRVIEADTAFLGKDLLTQIGGVAHDAASSLYVHR